MCILLHNLFLSEKVMNSSEHLLLYPTDSSQSFRRHTLNYLQEIGNGWFGKVDTFKLYDFKCQEQLEM